MNKRNIFSYCLLIILIFIIFKYFISEKYIDLIKNISNFSLFVSICLALIIYSISGFQYSYILKKNYSKSFNIADVFLLPITMNLWNYIIPFQGGLWYSIAFYKFKYKVKISQGLSIGIYIYMLTTVLTGLMGIYFVIINKMFFSILTLISVIFILNPLIVYVLNFIFKRLSFNKKTGILKKLHSFTYSTIQNVNNLRRNLKMSLIIILINIIHSVVSIIWFYWISVSLGLSIPFISIVILTLITKLSIIFKFTPGNLGIGQLVSGGVLTLLGGIAGDGVLISLFTTFSCILITFSIGIIANSYYMKYFQIKDFKSMYKSLLTQASEEKETNII